MLYNQVQAGLVGYPSEGQYDASVGSSFAACEVTVFRTVSCRIKQVLLAMYGETVL